MTRPDGTSDGGEAGVERRFWCFISYRHADNSEKGREWASWLHRELETFAVPDELVGSDNAWGEPVPARIYPVFRDEEELPAYADLSAAIIHALQQSLNLVVICSPRARESRFVHEEILRFKALGKADRAYGIVIRGDPLSDGEDACLPTPLVRRVDAAGTVHADAEQPLLIDLRDEVGSEEWIDPRMRVAVLRAAGLEARVAASEAAAREARLQTAKLGVIAAVLGVPAGQLIAAHQRRLRRERLGRVLAALGWVALAALALAALVVGFRYATAMREGALASSRESRTELRKADELARDSAEKRAKAEALLVERLRGDGFAFLRTRRPAEAAAAFREASEKGDAASALELARLLLGRDLGPPDAAAARALLEKAVAAGNPAAMTLLAGQLVGADGAPAPRALSLLRDATRLGEAGAELQLAQALRRTDPAESVRLLRKLAQAGDTEACWLLACELRAQAAPAAAPEPSAEWLAWMSRAADTGHAAARREFGRAVWGGDATRTEPAESVRLLRRLAQAGDTEACWLLACELRAQAAPAAAPEPSEEWLAWMSRAADTGHTAARREFGRAVWGGDATRTARFPDETRQRALRHLVELAGANDPEARQVLVRIYAQSANYPAQPAEALDFALRGAKAGVPDAMVAVARHHAARARSDDDPAGVEAVNWYNRLAKTHLALAMTEMGRWYQRLLAESPSSAATTRYVAAARRCLDAAASHTKDPALMVEAAKAAAAGFDNAARVGWLTKAEAAGNAEARRLLVAYLLRELQDSQAALALLRKGVEAGDVDSALTLGDWMASYAQSPAQRSEALEVYLRAAALGDGRCAARATALMRAAQVPASDLALAYRQLRRGAETGDATCRFEHARGLIAGGFAQGTPAEAHACLVLAAQAGRADECAPLLAALEARMGPAERRMSERLRAELAAKPAAR